MELDEAVARAERWLRAAEQPGLPLRLVDREHAAAERPWCYAFGWNSVAFLDRREITAMVPSGLLVVPKDGGDPFLLPSALPDEQALDEQERKLGLR